MEDDKKYEARTVELAISIRGCETELERLSQHFRVKGESGSNPELEKWSADFWRRNTFGNALVRVGQLTKNNFRFIDTIGVLAVSRYIFELSIWLRLFQRDSRYCLVYYWRLLDTQRRCWEDTVQQLQREVALLKRLNGMDSAAQIEIRWKYKQGMIGASEVAGLMKKASGNVDAEAGRGFSLYVEDAKTNGYGLQADIIERKAIPAAEKAVAQIAKEIEEYKCHVPQDVQNLTKGRWQWKQMATEAGIQNEYDYIYSFASRLLHAEPPSLTTDHKNLEFAEINVFLRYIHVKIVEIMDLARSQPECRANAPCAPSAN